MEYYLCPACHQLTSENFKNEFNKIECRKIVNRNGKFTMCGFHYHVNEFNTYTAEGKKNGAKRQEKDVRMDLQQMW